ncbi:MAG: hypothetical protein COB85_09650, partial [Bacteroidetes bacterium]
MLRINLIAAHKIQKEAEKPDDCQDAFQTSDDRFAIADGVTESFYSKSWAELLVNHYCQHPAIGKDNWKEWLLPIQNKWLEEVAQRVKKAKERQLPIWVTNYKRHARSDAAVSTFVGVQLD